MSSIIGTPSPDPVPPQQQPQQPPPPGYQQQGYQQQPQYYVAPPQGTGMKFPILFGAVIALVGACVYLFYQMNQMRTDLSNTRDALMAQIAKEQETSAISSETTRREAEALKKELAAAQKQASLLAGQAKIDATKHADEIANRLERVQQQQAAQVSAVSSDVTQVKTQASATQSKVGEVSSSVDNLKTQQTATQSQLEKTIADLKRTSGDLGVQSDLIATNGKELAALKALGERNYTEFTIAKAKKPVKVGDVQVRLKSADVKHNRFTLELIADDKTVEKKDRTINEPIQFLLSRSTQPYELVVNEVHKNTIKGYLSAPKVQQARK